VLLFDAIATAVNTVVYVAALWLISTIYLARMRPDAGTESPSGRGNQR